MAKAETKKVAVKTTKATKKTAVKATDKKVVKKIVKKVTTSKKVEAVKEVSVKAISPKEASEKKEFAVIQVSGNQYLVEIGKEYIVKKLAGNKGNEFVCEEVLLLVQGDKVQVGKPFVKGVKVECEISSQKKGEKVNTFRYTAKSRFRKRVGSRALLTRLLIKKFVTAGK